MVDYYVMKVETCPDCGGRSADPNDPSGPICIACKCTGKIQSVATLQEAFENTPLGKGFFKVLEDSQKILKDIMNQMTAEMVSRFNNTRGVH